MTFRHRIRSGLYFGCTFVEAVAVLGARRVRTWLGQAPPPDATATFLRLFMLHVLGRQTHLRITCADRTDGAGAQAHTIMSAMAFARACGHRYVHTPFVEIDHADRPMAEWVAAWEQLFNLGEGEEPANPGTGETYNYSYFHPKLFHAIVGGFRPGDTGAGARRQRHFQPHLFHSDSHPQSFEAIIPDLRRKYWRGRMPTVDREISVAVHVRRGDVTAEHSMRYTTSAQVLRTVRAVKALVANAGADCSIRLFSEGSADDFAPLRAAGVALCLNSDALWTMQQLIAADILVMSKSSFSYVAALISDGLKLYEPFWHSPLEDWIIRDSSGRFDQRRLASRLTDLQRRKKEKSPTCK